ncbi:MAG: response regulator [Pseudomonadota bacterium]
MNEVPITPPSGEKPKYPGQEKLSALTYLVVDDDNYMRTLLKDFLQMLYGISNVLEAECSAEALDLFTAHGIDVLLTNFKMPDMTGEGLVWCLRRSPDERLRHIPVVMVSAYTDRDHIRHARDAGIDEFVPKPCTATDLHAGIHKAVFGARPFVVAPDYIGPDRRRKDKGAPAGHERRGAKIG